MENISGNTIANKINSLSIVRLPTTKYRILYKDMCIFEGTLHQLYHYWENTIEGDSKELLFAIDQLKINNHSIAHFGTCQSFLYTDVQYYIPAAYN